MYRCAYLRQLRGMVGRSDSHLNHPDLQLPRIRRDEAGVYRYSLVELMETCWLNPLSPDNVELVSLSTATVAPPDVRSQSANDVIDAHRIGEAAYQPFRQEWLEANSVTIQFHDEMTKK